MRTFAERRQLARETGNRVATEARLTIPDYAVAVQAVVDYVLTETDGLKNTYTARLAAYHNLLADLAHILD